MLSQPAWAVVKAEDTFTEAANTALSAHTPSPTGTSWTVSAATIQVNGANDNVELTDTITHFAKEGTNVGTATMSVTADCTPGAVDDAAGVFGRGTSTLGNFDDLYNCYGVGDGTNTTLILQKRLAAANTDLGTFGTGIAQTTTITIRLETPDTKNCFVNNVSRITSTDNAVSTGNFAGIKLFDTAAGNSSRLDNFKSEDTVTITRRTMLLGQWRPFWREVMGLLFGEEAEARIAHPAPEDKRPLQHYVTTVCGDGSDQAPRRPCGIPNGMDWVLVYDGGTYMAFKASADQLIHNQMPPEAKRYPKDFPESAKAYLALKGEGTISGR